MNALRYSNFPRDEREVERKLKLVQKELNNLCIIQEPEIEHLTCVNLVRNRPVHNRFITAQ